jgi:hypothetical protein
VKILCSSCGRAHAVDKPVNGDSFNCAECGKPVKVIICPECSVVYSITYAELTSPGYRMSCRKCRAVFTVSFSAEYAAMKQKKSGDRAFTGRGSEPSLPVALPVEKKPNRAANPPLNKPAVPETGAAFTKPGSEPLFAKRGSDPLRHTVNLSAFLEKCGAFFTLKNLLITAIGTSASLVLSGIISSISSATGAQGFTADLLLTMNGFILLAGYTVTASLLCLRENGRVGSPADSVVFLIKSASRALMLFTALALALSGVSAIVSLIPLVGPVLFALLFLPAYVAFIVLGIAGVVSFWFYPPVTAGSRGGLAEGMKRLITFTKRHNFRLIYLIFIISAVSALLGGLLYTANFLSIKLCVTFLGGMVPEEAAKVYASIPPGMHRIFDVAQAGTDIGTMKLFMESLLASHQLAGLILGTAIALISLFIVSSFVICLAALSYQAYILLEEGYDIDDGALLRLLGILFSLLGIIYLLRLLLR